MDVYLRKNVTHVTADMTATHAAVKQLTKMVQEHVHKLYLDNSSPNSFNDLIKQKINCCGQSDLGKRQNLSPQND
jgi:hypothetical protein